jgi:hypothetical protein
VFPLPARPGPRPAPNPARPQWPPAHQPRASSPAGPPVKKITISGSVPIESWHELFRCFVRPSADLKPKNLKLGVAFERAFDSELGIPADSPAIRIMQEAARQLDLDLNIQESKPERAPN